MARYQAITELLLQWSEKGGDLPAKVKRELDQLSQGGGQTTGVMDKLGAAFNRLERREPLVAMRALRGAVDDLAVSAIGATGPAGRLVASFATLGGGGLSSIAVLGSVGIVLGSLKFATSELLNPLIQATEGLDKFTAGLTKAKTAGEQLRDLQNQLAAAAPRAGLLVGLFGNAPGFLGGIGAGAGDALDRAAAASQAARDALLASRHRTAIEAIQDLEVSTAALFSNAEEIARVTAAQKEWNAADTEAYAIAARKHANAVQAIADAKALADVLDGFAIIQGKVNELLADPNFQSFLQSIPTGLPMHQAGELETLDQLSARSEHFLGMITQHPEWNPRLGGMSLQQIGNAGAADETGSRALPVLLSLMGLVGGVRGGATGILAGLGGVAGAAGFGPIGAVIGAFSGLIGLFSGGHARFTISRFEQEAEEQMRHVLRLPAFYSSNVIAAAGTDPRATLSRLDRAQRLDTVRRGY